MTLKPSLPSIMGFTIAITINAIKAVSIAKSMTLFLLAKNVISLPSK